MLKVLFVVPIRYVEIGSFQLKLPWVVKLFVTQFMLCHGTDQSE